MTSENNTTQCNHSQLIESKELVLIEPTRISDLVHLRHEGGGRWKTVGDEQKNAACNKEQEGKLEQKLRPEEFAHRNFSYACSAGSLIRFLITYTNCPIVRSAGTRYFFYSRRKTNQKTKRELSFGFHPLNERLLYCAALLLRTLSMSGMFDFSAFSAMTGIRSGYFKRMRSASAFLFSGNCKTHKTEENQ
jgi:hypothetical protein